MLPTKLSLPSPLQWQASWLLSVDRQEVQSVADNNWNGCMLLQMPALLGCVMQSMLSPSVKASIVDKGRYLKSVLFCCLPWTWLTNPASQAAESCHASLSKTVDMQLLAEFAKYSVVPVKADSGELDFVSCHKAVWLPPCFVKLLPAKCSVAGSVASPLRQIWWTITTAGCPCGKRFPSPHTEVPASRRHLFKAHGSVCSSNMSEDVIKLHVKALAASRGLQDRRREGDCASAARSDPLPSQLRRVAKPPSQRRRAVLVWRLDSLPLTLARPRRHPGKRSPCHRAGVAERLLWQCTDGDSGSPQRGRPVGSTGAPRQGRQECEAHACLS